MRDWLNQHPGLAAGIAVVVLAVCAGLVWYSLRDARPDVPTEAFFLDLGTGQLFQASLQAIPPIPAPSGHTLEDGSPGAVKAYVYACGSCGDPSARRISYLERFTPEAKQRREELIQRTGLPVERITPRVWQEMRSSPNDGKLLASADAPEQWESAEAPAGQQIMATPPPQCDDGRLAQPCFLKVGAS